MPKTTEVTTFEKTPEGKLKEVVPTTTEHEFTYLEVLTALEGLEKDLTDYAGVISIQKEIWLKRKAKCIELGLDTIV